MSNWRYNPRTGTYNAVSITDEIHTIAFDTEANAYGIRLDEAPQRSSPSTVTITETASGGSTFTEISSRTAPSAGQFWVDYDADTFTGTGFIEFNASDSGTEVSVDYQGLGSVVKDDEVPRLSADNAFTGDNTFSGANTLSGNNTFSGNNSFTGNDDYQGSLNVPSGESISHNGTPVAGYLDDGTPIYCKTVSVTIGNGLSSASANHGISGNPMTNNLLLGMICYLDGVSSFGAFSTYSQDGTTSANYIRFNDTQVTIGRSSSGGPTDYLVMIWYKQ